MSDELHNEPTVTSSFNVGFHPNGVALTFTKVSDDEEVSRAEHVMSGIDAIKMGSLISALGTAHITMEHMERMAMAAMEQEAIQQMLQQNGPIGTVGPGGLIIPR